ncbi:MAG: cytochrome c peroxidase [Pyrinomonadaceae bacterium]
MKILKFVVIVVFVSAAALVWLSRSNPVTGQGGGTSLSAPTGVTATDNIYNNKVGVHWDTIRGATSYRIFRNTTNTTTGATDLGTTAAPFFFDAGAIAGQTFFYFVRAENGTEQSPMSASDQGVRSTTIQVGPVPPLEPPPPAPPANPLTARKAYLGKALFWDEQMSSTHTVSCGTCHLPGAGGADPRVASNPGPDNTFGSPDDIGGTLGVPSSNADGSYLNHATYGLNDQVTSRNSTSAVNAVYFPLLFWDGRATGTFRDPVTTNILINAGGALESQAAGPPTSDVEMAHSGRNWNDVAARMAASKPLALSPTVPAALSTWINGRTYPELFEEAFGTPDVTPSRIALAIGTYERTLFSDQTPLDLANAGITPLNAAAQRGRNIFTGPAACNVCHAGNLLTDNSFRDIGVRPSNEDTGRFQVTGNANNIGQFRVPSLRNVALRPRFFHNGRFTTLDQVVAFYNRGGDFPNNPNVPNNLIRPLGLTQAQQTDVVAFLQSLTDPRVAAETGSFDRPTLYTQSNRVPQITGTGRAGSGAATPLIRGISPPIAGNSNFTVSVNRALGNANAVLVIDSVDPGVGTTIPATGSFARVTTTTQNTGAANGWASLTMPIPATSNIVGRTFFARWYVQDAGAANGFSVSQAVRFTVFGEATTVNRPAFVDFDGDRKTDISVYRPSSGQWWISKSSDNQLISLQFGVGTDNIVPADYTGDGKTDIAVWRPASGEWFVLRSEDNSFFSFPFGQNGDIPAPGDFDNDGRADVTVFRPSSGTWFTQASTQGTIIQQFGTNGDVPQTGDYDGDGRADVAIFRPSNGQWWINRSTAGVIAGEFGTSTDKPVAHDFTGDGKTDVAFWRPSSGEWFILRSEDSSYFAFPFGLASDIPAPGDYDGDGKSDAAVFRPASGTWFANRSTQGTLIATFGVDGDRPAPNAYTP